MSHAPAIEVHELHKTYRDGLIFPRRFHALKGVSLQVAQGEIFGLLGPNGAGKTTLVKVLLGVVRKTQGTAMLLGRPAGDRLGRRSIGYLPENLRVPRHLTANSALDLYGQLSGLSSGEIRRRRQELLESVDLASRAKDSVKKYSKGMLQRLGLAIALLHRPQVVFMDEPTDGLDPGGRAHVRQVLQRLKAEGTTIFLNSHLLQEVEMVCDRVAILDKGIVRRIGTVDELAVNQLEGLKIRLQLIGREADVRAALDGRADYQMKTLGVEAYELTLRLTDQAGVDACVDSLRSHGLSIVGLERHRISLEEVFLELLGLKTDKS